jgi:hypothetical protein
VLCDTKAKIFLLEEFSKKRGLGTARSGTKAGWSATRCFAMQRQIAALIVESIPFSVTHESPGDLRESPGGLARRHSVRLSRREFASAAVR